jgi:uncharacterized RDD family membrane protein YckC
VTTAGIVSRGLAALVDMLAVVIVMGAIYLGLVLTTLIVNPATFRFPEPSLIFSTTATLAVSVLYLTGCWTVSGRTVGTVVLGVRVVDKRAKSLRIVVAAVRAVACVLFPVGLLWVAVDRQRRSVQDVLLGSRVIYDSAGANASVR